MTLPNHPRPTEILHSKFMNETRLRAGFFVPNHHSVLHTTCGTSLESYSPQLRIRMVDSRFAVERTLFFWSQT